MIKQKGKAYIYIYILQRLFVLSSRACADIHSHTFKFCLKIIIIVIYTFESHILLLFSYYAETLIHLSTRIDYHYVN